MSDDIGLRNGGEDVVLFLTSFRTNHVTCCVSAGEGAEGVVCSRLTQHSPRTRIQIHTGLLTVHGMFRKKINK